MSLILRVFAFVLFVIGVVLAFVGADARIIWALLFGGLACWVLSTIAGHFPAVRVP